MKVCDIMSGRVVSVQQQENVASAARLLKRHNLGALPVCDERGRLRGMITDRDIAIRCVAGDADPGDTKISEIMSRAVTSVRPFDEVEEAAGVMSREQLRRLPVLDEGRLVGMVTLCDLARSAQYEMEAAEALTEISASMRRK